MRKIALVAAATAAMITTPAVANETRLELRTGAVWNSDAVPATFASLGAAAGYDFDLGSAAFAGLEVSADKLLITEADLTFGFSARAGAKISESGKLYVIGGYATTFEDDADDWTLGAGYQHSFNNVYVKAEYRRGIDTKDNAVLTGIGIKF